MVDDKKYMELALMEAKKAAALGEVPVGAVLVNSEGGVVVCTHNERETAHDATAHAEILALRRGGAKLSHWRLSDCTLYVTLEPCPMCAGAIVAARIGRLVYGAVDSRAGAVESIFNIPGHPSLAADMAIRAGVMEDECRDVLQEFFADRR